MSLIRAGKKEVIPSPIRADPLTGTTGRVLNLTHYSPKKPNAEEACKRSEGIFCPFYPENTETSTPVLISTLFGLVFPDYFALGGGFSGLF